MILGKSDGLWTLQLWWGIAWKSSKQFQKSVQRSSFFKKRSVRSISNLYFSRSDKHFRRGHWPKKNIEMSWCQESCTFTAPSMVREPSLSMFHHTRGSNLSLESCEKFVQFINRNIPHIKFWKKNMGKTKHLLGLNHQLTFHSHCWPTQNSSTVTVAMSQEHGKWFLRCVEYQNWPETVPSNWARMKTIEK